MKPLSSLLLILCGLLAPLSAGDSPPHIVGHRGLIKHAPENTLAGFAACLNLRFGFEVDIRRGKDRSLLCLHDETVDRTTSGKGKLASLSPEDLAKLDAGQRFDAAFSRERIPTLGEVLDLLAGKKDALAALDIKEEDLEEDIVALVAKRGLPRRVVCIGLTIERPALRKKLRGADKNIGIAVLAQTAKDFSAALEDPFADWIYVRFVPSADQVEQIHKQGKKVFIAGATVAGLEAENWRRCQKARVDAILTDYPLECRQALRAR